ncbi:exported phospholipase [Alicyclobacillus contaminans]|uniref:patatin-like phospholipase family protein n=1 Tax=Alicyclobacillus contaminans TaxID=392016 RepID=UPI0004075735|nr:patatin-like phospholipase family protein [Alicyclobacillus contaminans]GMA52533.1 exported phospholipase [Alicyclobacillus contaminans]
MLKSPHNRIGIALSGGSLKATAHIGVLRALNTLGIQPDCVAGTSAGAFIAALYAHDYTPDELLHLIRRFPGPSLLDYGFPVSSSVFTSLWYRFRRSVNSRTMRIPSGLLRGDKLYRYFRQHFKGRTPSMPYYVIAADLMTGQPVTYSNNQDMIDQGLTDPIVDPALCVRGSCALPGIFTPVRIGSRILVDGAFRHYVPVKILRQAGCNKIIAVNLYSLQHHWQPETIVHVLVRSYDILLQESVEGDLAGDDVMIIEPKVGHFSWLSTREMEHGVTVGQQAVWDQQHRIEQWLRSPATADHRHTASTVQGVCIRISAHK